METKPNIQKYKHIDIKTHTSIEENACEYINTENIYRRKGQNRILYTIEDSVKNIQII